MPLVWGWFIPLFWGFSIIGHDIIPKIIHYWGWIIHYFPFIPLFFGIFHYNHDLPCIPHGWTLRQRDEALESKRQVDRWWVSPCRNGTKPFGKNGGGKKCKKHHHFLYHILEVAGIVSWLCRFLWIRFCAPWWNVQAFLRSHGKTFVAMSGWVWRRCRWGSGLTEQILLIFAWRNGSVFVDFG